MSTETMTMKIKLHSMVDVITNSSSVIYTYSDGSIEPAKNLIREIFKLFGVDLDPEDVFNIYVVPDFNVIVDRFDDWLYDLDETEREKYSDYDKLSCSDKPEYIEKLYLKNIENNVKDYWMDFSEMEEDTWLRIESKRPVYNKLAELLKDFLYSTKHEEGYN